MASDLYMAAVRRLEGAPELCKYHDVLLWGFGDGGSRKHWQWVAQGNTAELLAWAREREEADGWATARTPTPAPALADAGQWAQAGLFDA